MNKVNRFKIYGYLFITLVAVVYSLPNFYGESPAIQLNTPNKINLTALKEDLSKLNISPVSIEEQEQSWLLKFDNTEAQLQSLKTLTAAHPNWVTALNLANNTPQWLMNLGAVPMKLGLDLRGGVHFLLNVDTVPAITLRVNADIKDMHTEIRKDHIKNIRIKNKNNQITALVNEEAKHKCSNQSRINDVAPTNPKDISKQNMVEMNFCLNFCH